MASSQIIQIYDLTRNPGLLTLQTGNMMIKTGRHRVYHSIDLDEYKPLLDNILKAINGLHIFTDFKDVNVLLYNKFTKVLNSYNRILPVKRYKRGAFNILGSGIKLITGNLDENDLVQINRDINELRQGNNEIVRQNNIQVKINKQMEKRINKIITTINNQQETIKQEIIAARQSMLSSKLSNQNFTIIRQIFKVSYHLDQVQNVLDSIFETIQLAKINIISRNFLETEELKFIVDRLEEQNITILNSDQAYNFLDIHVLFKGATLYFIIGVPQISSQQFNTLILEPLPINGNIIKLPWHKAAISTTSTYFIKNNCKIIGQNTLCDEDDLEDVSNDGCFSKIIRGQTGTCSFTRYHDMTDTKRITDNYIIVKNTSVLLSTDCKFGNRTLSGTFLVYFTNCSISLGGKSFSTTEFLTKPKPIIIPLDGITIKQKDFISNPDLHTIRKLHLQSREELHSIKKHNLIQTSTCLGLSSVCFILIVSIFIYLSFKKKPSPDGANLQINVQGATINNPDQTEDDINQITIGSGRSNLQGGVVNKVNPDHPTLKTPATIEEFIKSLG